MCAADMSTPCVAATAVSVSACAAAGLARVLPVPTSDSSGAQVPAGGAGGVSAGENAVSLDDELLLVYAGDVPGTASSSLPSPWLCAAGGTMALCGRRAGRAGVGRREARGEGCGCGARAGRFCAELVHLAVDHCTRHGTGHGTRHSSRHGARHAHHHGTRRADNQDTRDGVSHVNRSATPAMALATPLATPRAAALRACVCRCAWALACGIAYGLACAPRVCPWP